MAKKIKNTLNSFPELEKRVKEKDKLFHKLLKKQKKYEFICSFNCDEKEERSAFTWVLQNEYYCSSLEELHNKINNKLNETMEQLKVKIMIKLSSDNENYKESIKNIKNNLTDRALQEFGRTMYDILFLQDQYHHFVEDLNITVAEKNIFSLKELSVQLDDKLLQLDRVVETYGQHCKTCGKDLFLRGTRNTKSTFKEDSSENIVYRLIGDKFNETEVKIKNDLNKIFNELNVMVKEVENGNTDIANLKPIQEEILKMTNVEKEQMEALKSKTPQSTIKHVLDLINESHNLLKSVDEKIIAIKTLVSQ
ncbi:uncharacterized protein LOC123659383 [Melitaea cinxia]|uniref:uncharacterized protein LOC123659383 n=1 Tax=Melitaea cinxia TaxID=113334 RepID=UPI001E26F023|nr:uncharacterized protein LOC123659383 [Melitaea cinxia]